MKKIKYFSIILVTVTFLFAYHKCQSPDTLRNGLLAYYPFNGNANDESGNGFDCTIIGATLSSDRFDQSNSAFIFSGNEQYLTTDDIPSFDYQNSFSLSLWINTVREIKNNQVIIGKMTTFSDFQGWALLRISNDPENIFFILRNEGGNGINEVRCSFPFKSFNIWNSISVVYDGTGKATGVSFYLNGNKAIKTIVYDNLSATIVNNAPFNIGARDNGNAEFQGKIDEVRIYNRTLTENEIDQLYNN